MKNFYILISVFICTTFITPNFYAQKKVIDHKAYNDWKRLSNELISPTGKYIVYEINPHQGDGNLFIINNETQKEKSFPRAVNPQISYGEKFVCFKIRPGYDTLRKLELAKVDKKKWPKDTLGIYYFEQDTLIKIADFKSYELAERDDVLLYFTSDNEIKKVENSPNFWQKIKRIFIKPKIIEKPESNGNHMIVLDAKGKKIKEFIDVIEFTIAEDGSKIAMVQHQKIKRNDKSLDSVWLSVFKKNGEIINTTRDAIEIKSLQFSHDLNNLAFLISNDTNKIKQYSLGLFSLSTNTLKILADTSSQLLGQGKSVSDFRNPKFSSDDSKLYFGVANVPVQDPKDTLTNAEDVKLDIWSWKDDRLQPQQLVELGGDLRKSNLYVYLMNDARFVQLSNDTIQTYVSEYKDVEPQYILSYSDNKYSYANNWTYPNLSDHYRVEINTGKKEFIMDSVGFGGNLSPVGNHYIYYNLKDLNQYHINFITKDTTCITCGEKTVLWLADNNGMPHDPAPERFVGWLPNESGVVLESENDIWKYTFNDNKLHSLTNKVGLNNRIKMNLITFYDDSIYIYLEKSILVGMDRKTRNRTLYKYNGNYFEPKLTTPHDVFGFHSNDDLSLISYRLSSNKDYPDMYTNNFEFSEQKKITTTNPQQDEYLWSTVEQVSWYSYDSLMLEGLLYKPENFDSTKSYPMIVYFYELYSDELHNHYTPKPTASIVFPTEYASAGYVVFIPDVRYKAGYPAQSAYDCIMSGTDYILKKYPSIDSCRMGLQGQSWGGYQTAQLITMTRRYRAGMAGAPVANMFSAYGGIRWNSGLNRAFQYEKTQSRIGKTIWEAPELYIENSPLFGLPNVYTPLLIMHNDGDGSVPWYQGVELFTGLKRLQKPVWLLNYNGDDHNLMVNANRVDLSIRMRQFFDYYLQGKPEPQWMITGLPATKKGKVQAY